VTFARISVSSQSRIYIVTGCPTLKMKALQSSEMSVNTQRYIAGGVRESSLWFTDLMELPVISESQQAATTCRRLLHYAVQMYL